MEQETNINEWDSIKLADPLKAITNDDFFIKKLSPRVKHNYLHKKKDNIVVDGYILADNQATHPYLFERLMIGVKCFSINLVHKQCDKINVEEYFEKLGEFFQYLYNKEIIDGTTLGSAFMLECPIVSLEYNVAFDENGIYPLSTDKNGETLLKKAYNWNSTAGYILLNKGNVPLNPELTLCRKIFSFFVYPTVEVQKQITGKNEVNALNEMIGFAAFSEEGEISKFEDWDILGKIKG